MTERKVYNRGLKVQEKRKEKTIAYKIERE